MTLWMKLHLLNAFGAGIYFCLSIKDFIAGDYVWLTVDWVMLLWLSVASYTGVRNEVDDALDEERAKAIVLSRPPRF